MKPIIGKRAWNPESGKRIQHGNGNEYMVDDEHPTIRRVVGATEDAQRTISAELRRLGWRTSAIRMARNGDDILVALGKTVKFTDAYDLLEALRALPSHCGHKAIINACQHL